MFKYLKGYLQLDLYALGMDLYIRSHAWKCLLCKTLIFMSGRKGHAILSFLIYECTYSICMNVCVYVFQLPLCDCIHGKGHHWLGLAGRSIVQTVCYDPTFVHTVCLYCSQHLWIDLSVHENNSGNSMPFTMMFQHVCILLAKVS